ncbi:MAG: hypothetical protein ACM3KF_03470 [Acidobacteriota bacterium]
MINLLPPDDKKQLIASRTNSLLLRYTILLGVIVAVLAVEIAGMSFIVDLGKSQNETVIQDNEAKTAGYAPTRQKAEAFRSNLATAKYILDKQVPYTNLIFSLARSLPSGTVIDTLAIDPATFGTPTTLIVKTTSYQKAIDVKTSLQNAKINDTTPLFMSVSFQSVAVSESAGNYPYTATYNITYAKAALAQ